MTELGYGQKLVAEHLGQMHAMSRKRWPAIVERDGFRIVADRPYQGFDNDPNCQHRPLCGHLPEMYPEPRFWCRSICVERIADGARGWSVGPQADAYRGAIESIEGVTR